MAKKTAGIPSGCRAKNSAVKGKAAPDSKGPSFEKVSVGQLGKITSVAESERQLLQGQIARLVLEGGRFVHFALIVPY